MLPRGRALARRWIKLCTREPGFFFICGQNNTPIRREGNGKTCDSFTLDRTRAGVQINSSKDISTTSHERPIKRRVFLSYAREDADIADRLDRALRPAEYDEWIDCETVQVGFFTERIVDAIENTDVFLVLLSPNSLRSE